MSSSSSCSNGIYVNIKYVFNLGIDIRNLYLVYVNKCLLFVISYKVVLFLKCKGKIFYDCGMFIILVEYNVMYD